MTKAQIAAAIQTIVRLQLDDCKRAIKDGTKTIALRACLRRACEIMAIDG